MLSQQYPALILVAPLLASFVIFIAGWVGRRGVAWPLALAALATTTACAAGLLARIVLHGPLSYRLGGWPPPMGIEYYVDHLNALVLLLIAVVALCNLLANRVAIARDYAGKEPVFCSLYLLAVAGHMGIVVTGDAFNLYVLLEITALSGYSLLGMGNRQAPLATLRYLFMGTVGASFYLLGVGYLYIMTGSLNMLDLARLIPQVAGSPAITAAFVMIMAGAFIKMAFFPLHAWLPGAYSNAANPASSLIAPLTTKVMVYVMIRLMLTVFGTDFAWATPGLNQLMVWLAVAAMVTGGMFALAQRDLKRMLTFILISEVGYMVGGAWLGNRLGMTGSILHILNDAMMTFVVFLAAGSMLYKTGSGRFESLQGLFAKMPFTMGAFVIAGLSMIGVPPTCGFFSKWYLVLGGVEAGHWGFVAALILSSLINVVLFFRIFEIALFEPFAEGHGHGHQAVIINEAPAGMVVTLLVAAASLIALGLFTGDIVSRVIDLAIPANII